MVAPLEKSAGVLLTSLPYGNVIAAVPQHAEDTVTIDRFHAYARQRVPQTWIFDEHPNVSFQQCRRDPFGGNVWRIDESACRCMSNLRTLVVRHRENERRHAKASPLPQSRSTGADSQVRHCHQLGHLVRLDINPVAQPCAGRLNAGPIGVSGPDHNVDARFTANSAERVNAAARMVLRIDAAERHEDTPN